MQKLIILAMTAWVLSLSAVAAHSIGYTVFIRSQVVPQYNTVGDIQVLNPGETPYYPSTFRTKVCYSQPFSIYSDDASDRTEVWEDYAGTASDDDIRAACPKWNFANPSTGG